MAAIPFYGYSYDYLVSALTLSDGLSHPSVKCVLRDSKDYLWIGTKGGLNRVDKGRVSSYRHNPALKNSIPDNDIIDIFEDGNGKVWIICSTGVVCYNRQADNFEHVTTHDKKTLRARSHLLLPSGILFGGAGNIFFYDYNTKDIKTKDTKGGSEKYYTSIHPWTRDRYLLATRWDGLWIYNTKTGDIERFPIFDGRRVMASAVDSDGDLWISEYGEGIHLISRAGQIIPLHIPDINNSGIVLDILECDGKMIFATDGEGLISYDKISGKSERIDTQENFSGTLRSVNCLYRDDYDYIYAGTVRGGLIYMHPTPMLTIGVLPEMEAFTVTSLVADRNKYWVGIDGNGIMLFEPDNANHVTPIPETKGLKIVSLDNFDDHNLLVSTYDSGLYLFDKSKGTLSSPPNWIKIISDKNKSTGIPIDIKRLPGDKIALVTDKIYISDLSGSKVSVIEPNQSMNARLRVFYTDTDHMLCYNEQEVFQIDLDEEKATSLFKTSGNYVECATFDGNRFIYAGTSSGVEQFDFETGKVISSRQRLPAGSGVTAIAYNDGKLWIGALGRLFMRELPDGKIRNFGPDDGVAPNEFIYKSIISTPQHLLMGGVNGLLKISLADIDDYKSRHSNTHLTLGEVIIDGLPVDMDKNIAKLPDNYSTVKLRLTGGNPNPVVADAVRIYIGQNSIGSPIESDDNTLTLGHLQSTRGGRYDIYASIKDDEGKWTKPNHVGAILVPVAWWQKPFAIVIICILAAIALGLGIIYLYSRRKNKVVKRMEAHKRKDLEKEVGFLMNLNYELRTPLTLIYSRLKMLTDSVNKGNIPENKMIEELDNIYRSTSKMRDIINTTVDLWRSGDMQTGENLEEIEVDDWIREMLTEIKPLLQEKRLSVSTDGLQTHLKMTCDLKRATIALHNVLRTTINHAAEKTEISLESNEVEEYIRIQISFFNDDSHGAGEEFRYADHLMALMDGELTYTRNDDTTPSVIVMEFPRKLKRNTELKENASNTALNVISTDPSSEEEKAINENPDFDLSHLTAIVVEEEPELRELFVSALSSKFKRVLEASNGKDALTFIKNSNPDIIITEARLPQMTGLELCRIIKKTKEYSHIPVIMLTTRLEEMSIANGNNYGADNYLTKPFDIGVLEKRCVSVLKSFDRVRQWYRSQASDILPTDKRHSNDAEAFVLKVKDIIAQNIHTAGFGVDDVVEKMLVSRSTLYSRFKELTGQSLGNYINDYKVNRAKEMLATTNMTMVEISDALGFTTQRYFSTFFKDKTGVTPTAFRSNLLERTPLEVIPES